MKPNPVKKLLLSAFPLLLLPLLFPGCSKQPSTPPHILLVTVDTLRPDHLGFNGWERNTSPFMDQLAKTGIVFKNTITPLPLTDGSHSTILTGLHPLVHNVRNNATRLPDRIETIAETLKKNGYYTIGAVSVYHLGSHYNFNQGFDAFSDKWGKDLKPDLGWQRVAKYTNEDLFKEIDEYKKNHSKKPLFIWVHYYDPHTPYINWKHISFKPQKRMKYKGKELYDKDIRYADDAIRALHGHLEKHGLKERLITCVTSDHGEQLGEHGTFADHLDFYSETIFVPFILQGYDIPGNKVVEHYVSTMDVAPTLLGLVDLGFPAPVHGINLLNKDREAVPPPASKREFVIIGFPRHVRSVQWVKEPYSYIMNTDHYYKYWYVTTQSDFPEKKLNAVPKSLVTPSYDKKLEEHLVFIDYPYKIRTGLHYGVLRFEIGQNRGVSVGYDVGSRITSRHEIKDNKNKTVTAYFPITVRDRLTAVIYRKKESKVGNLRFAILPAEDMKGFIDPRWQKDSKIFKVMTTLRKTKRRHELYDLGTDFKMRKNLLKGTGRTPLPKAVEGRKAIYSRLKQYLKELKKQARDPKKKKKLTDKEKEMLKSLGYL